MPDHPPYIVWVGANVVHICDTLAAALDVLREEGGTVYEPMRVAATRQQCGYRDGICYLENDGGAG